ncbi:MAG: hypothetical protein PVJ21_15985 [Anaerolineales bacterium]|jgi:hypothetical protein
MNSEDLKDKLIAFTAKRYQVQSDKDLNDYIFSNYLFHSYDPALIEFVFKNRREINDLFSDDNQLQELIDFCNRSTKQYTYKRNQYINYPHQYETLLQAEYQSFFAQIKSLLETSETPEKIADDFGKILSDHHTRLRLILASYCISYGGEPLSENALLQSVPCEEYSAPLQLKILNIDIDQLSEPILDVGCGSDGKLVHYLRRKGLGAFGMDRLAPAGPEFIQKDWFDFAPGQTWGTVIAHQFISTHFIYNHLNNPMMAKQYARLFMTLLSALGVHGSLYYAPGVPFFEGELAEIEEYVVSKTHLAIDTFGIGEIAYATRIQRVAS